MSQWSRKIKGLEDTFPMSGPGGHEVGDLTSFAQLVHPVFGPLQRIGSGERQRVNVAGGAGSTQETLTTGPVGRVRVVEYAYAFHDDPTSRAAKFLLRPFNLAVNIVIDSSTYHGLGVVPPGALEGFPMLNGPIALGPGDVLRIAIPIAAGFFINGEAIVIDYAIADGPSFRG